MLRASSTSIVGIHGLLTLLLANQSVGELLSSGATAAEMIRSRGYEAVEYRVTVSDGYVLTVVRARNPLIGKQTDKDPILCVHGTPARAAFFVANPNKGDYAKDDSALNISSMSAEELDEHFDDDPAANSIVYLALNVGYEVWLLNKRGTRESQGHVRADQQPYLSITGNSPALNGSLASVSGLGSGLLGNSVGKIVDFLAEQLTRPSNIANPKYWNFSLDEQAKFDIPEVVDYIIEKSGRQKVTFVGHSAGAGLAVMALTVHPDLADKLSKVVLWAPAFNLGAPSYFNPTTLLAASAELVLSSYIGPFPPSTLLPAIRDLISANCLAPVLDATVCRGAADLLFGRSGGLVNFVRQMADIVGGASSHEIAQLAQSVGMRRVRMYNFGSVGNLRAYGEAEPPIYDVSRIKSKQMSIWYGATDTLVTPGDVELLISDLRVPLQVRYFNESGVFFNHMQFGLHSNVARLLIIPTLRTIAQ